MQAAVNGIRRRRHPNGRRYTRHAGALLNFFGEHRTAVASQVQRYFPDLLPSDRTTRLHLQTLVASRELAVVRDGGFSTPNVYCITQKGLRAVIAGSSFGSEKRRRTPTGSHLQHELLITELAVLLREFEVRNRSVAIAWQDRFGLWINPAFRSLVPDYAFMFRQVDGLMVCLTEVSSGEDSPTRIRQKLEHYAEWSSTPEPRRFLEQLYAANGAREPRPHFRLAFVVQNRRSGQDETRLRQVFGGMTSLNAAAARRIWVTTVQRLSSAGCLNGQIWSRGQDLVTAVADWDSLAVRLRRERLSREIGRLPLHCFFPKG